MLMIPDLRVGYQNIPKVATTSLFGWLYQAIALVKTGKPPVHPFHRREFFSGGPGRPPLAREVANTAGGVAPYRDFYCFAITRDPLRRFLSMYSNRVVFHRELAANRRGNLLERAGLEPDPEINLLVDRFDAYCKVQGSVLHHASPMMGRLGPDLGVYRRIVDIAGVQQCIDEIAAHLAARGHADAVAKLPVLGRSQTGGPKLGLEVLNPFSFEKLLDYYREDYAQLPTVDLQATKEAWRKAREQAFVALSQRVDAALADDKAGGRRAAKGAVEAKAKPKARARARAKAKAKAGGSPAGAMSGPAAGTGSAGKGGPGRVEYPACELVLKARVHAPAKGQCTGVVVLAPQASGDFDLQLSGPGGTRALEWGLDSPRTVERFAGNPHARKARFRGEAASAGRYEIRLVRRAGGQAWPVARFGVAAHGSGKD
jgi:hypothetical protein